MKRAILSFITAVALAGGATSASATIIIGGSAAEGTSFKSSFVGQIDGQVEADISNTLDLTFTDLSANGRTYSFDYMITNTSDIASRLRSFGFNVVGGTVTAVSSTGAFAFTQMDRNFPEGVGKLDVCFAATSNGGCTGGQGGLISGQSGNGTLTFTLAAPTSSLTISDVTTRFQSITGGGYNGASGVGLRAAPPVVPAVPEPSTWLMLILGFAAVGGMMRRGSEQKPLLRLA